MTCVACLLLRCAAPPHVSMLPLLPPNLSRIFIAAGKGSRGSECKHASSSLCFDRLGLLSWGKCMAAAMPGHGTGAILEAPCCSSQLQFMHAATDWQIACVQQVPSRTQRARQPLAANVQHSLLCCLPPRTQTAAVAGEGNNANKALHCLPDTSRLSLTCSTTLSDMSTNSEMGCK